MKTTDEMDKFESTEEIDGLDKLNFFLSDWNKGFVGWVVGANLFAGLWALFFAITRGAAGIIVLAITPLPALVIAITLFRSYTKKRPGIGIGVVSALALNMMFYAWWVRPFMDLFDFIITVLVGLPFYTHLLFAGWFG